jgi:serine/threonine protein kinase
MAAEIIHQQQQHQQQHQQHQSDIIKHESISREQRSAPIKMIGNYTLQQSIGKGSMGKVKLATHNVTGEKVRVTKSIKNN